MFVLDAKGRKFRSDIYENYKANRPPCPIDLVPQFDLVRAAATAFGIPQLESVGFEADDVIATLATLATQQGVNVNIISSDKDLMQVKARYTASDDIELSTNTVRTLCCIVLYELSTDGCALCYEGHTSDRRANVAE